MAKRRSTPRQRMRSLQRDLTTPIAKPRLLLTPKIRPVDLRAFEDRRLFTPKLSAWPKRIVRRAVLPARVIERSRDPRRVLAKTSLNRLGMAFEAPKRVLVCVRRKQRREVLHALNKTRKGAGARKRRNQWSNVSC